MYMCMCVHAYMHAQNQCKIAVVAFSVIWVF